MGYGGQVFIFSVFRTHEVVITPETRLRLIFLGLALAVLAVFGRLAACDFVFFDDHVYVIEKAQVLSGLTPDSLWWALTATDAGFWHPLTWISLMIDHELWGLNPGGYHLTNVLLHLGATLLLFAGLRRLTGEVVPSGFVAALFALHPLHVESVAWIAERKDVLSGFFWMLTLLLYARYVERPGWGRYLPVLLSFILGLAAKPMVVTLPMILLLLDVWPGRRLTAENWRRNRRLVAGEKIPMLLLGVVVGMVTVAAEHQVGALKTFTEFPLSSRLANAVVAYGFYLYKAVWPAGLAVHYPHPGTWPSEIVVLSLAVLGAVSFLAVWRFKTAPYLLVGWLWYLVSLLPVSGLIQIGSHAFADRYSYIPLTGVFIAVVWGVGEWAAKQGKAHFTAAKQAELPGPQPGEIAALFSTGGEEGNKGTLVGRQDTDAFFAVTGPGGSAAETYSPPEAEPANDPGLQAVACQNGDRPTAAPLAAWETMGIGQCVAASVKKDDPAVSPAVVTTAGVAIIVVLALTSIKQAGYWQDAETLFRRSVAVTDNNWLAYNNLGAALSRQGRHGEAAPQFETALRLRPDYTEALFNLGAALAGQGRYAEALTYYRRVLARQPAFAEVHNNIAIAYAETGDPVRAALHFREALRIRPDYKEALANLKIIEFSCRQSPK